MLYLALCFGVTNLMGLLCLALCVEVTVLIGTKFGASSHAVGWHVMGCLDLNASVCGACICTFNRAFAAHICRQLRQGDEKRISPCAECNRCCLKQDHHCKNHHW